MWIKTNYQRLLVVIFLFVLVAGCRDNNINIESSSLIGEGDEEVSTPPTQTVENPKASEPAELSFFEEQLQLAEAGDIKAINYVATAYYDGDEVEQSYEKSFEWSMKAAKLDNAASQYNVGWLYEKGEGVEQDYKEAISWYSKAADNNFSKAINAMGYMNYFGYGTEINYKLAHSLFLKAAGGFEADAMLCLAEMYEDGVGIEQDIKASDVWYKIAANNKSDKIESYEHLQEQFDNKTYDIRIDSFEKNDSSIPIELILEAQKSLYSHDYFELFNKYNANTETNTDDLDLSEKITEHMGKLRRYDNYFIADINEDGTNEVLVYRLEGTMGISSFSTFVPDEEGKYHFDSSESEYVERQELWFGVPQLLRFENKYYFALVYSDNIDRTISSIEIFSFDDNKLNKSVTVSAKQGRMNYVKTSQSNQEMDELVGLIEADIENIMNATLVTQNDFSGDENKRHDTENIELFSKHNSDHEKINYFADIDNDGEMEYFYRNMWLTSSVNSFNHLQIEFFDHIDNKLMEADLSDFIKEDFLQGIMHQFFVKTYNGNNYIVILNQNYQTKNFNLSIYNICDNTSEQIATFLIYYLTDEINIDVNNEIKDINLAG